MKAFLNAAEFAKLLGVNRATVKRWIDKGELKGKGVVQVGKSKQWRVPLSVYKELSERKQYEGS